MEVSIFLLVPLVVPDRSAGPDGQVRRRRRLGRPFQAEGDLLGYIKTFFTALLQENLPSLELSAPNLNKINTIVGCKKFCTLCFAEVCNINENNTIIRCKRFCTLCKRFCTWIFKEKSRHCAPSGFSFMAIGRKPEKIGCLIKTSRCGFGMGVVITKDGWIHE